MDQPGASKEEGEKVLPSRKPRPVGNSDAARKMPPSTLAENTGIDGQQRRAKKPPMTAAENTESDGQQRGAKKPPMTPAENTESDGQQRGAKKPPLTNAENTGSDGQQRGAKRPPLTIAESTGLDGKQRRVKKPPPSAAENTGSNGQQIGAKKPPTAAGNIGSDGPQKAAYKPRPAGAPGRALAIAPAAQEIQPIKADDKEAQPNEMPVENVEAKLEEPGKKRKIDRADTTGRTSPSKTGEVKPILKKEIVDPSVKSGPRRKSALAQEMRKSVTFESEPSTISAMPPTKLMTLFGLSLKDCFVILVFWSVRFFIPWIESWHDFNFHLLREPSYWNPLEQVLRDREVIVFCVTSVITVAVSVLADFINFRFFIFILLLALYILCPVTGALLNGVLVARSFNQDFYRKYAMASETFFQWTFAISFISFPIQLSCIFGQKDNMPRKAHYNWTAFLVFLESTNHYAAFWKIPGRCPTKTFTQAAIWGLIGVLILIVLLLAANFSFYWVNPEMLHSNRYSPESRKFKEELSVDFAIRQRKKFMWFSSILVCLIVTSFVFATLDRLKPDEDWDKHYFLSATSMFLLGKIFGTMLMVVVLTVVRWKCTNFQRLPFLRADVLALGLPHLINLLALVTLLGRFATLSHLNEGDVIIGPLPDHEKMVVEFFNFDFRNRTVCVHSTSFRPLKILPRERGTRELYGLGSSRIHFTVTLDPQTTPGIQAVESFAYEQNTWATFIITLPFSSIRYTDVQALYGKLEVVRVEGTQSLRPKKEPQVFFINTFYLRDFPGVNWMFQVKQSSSGFLHEFRITPRWLTVVVEVPKGNLEIVFYLLNSTNQAAVKTEITAEGYSIWSVLLGHSRPMRMEDRSPPRMMKAFKTVEVAGPDSDRLPSKPELQRDLTVMAGMTLAGVASSGLITGMIYLFWLDTPTLSYRVTCVGVFWTLWKTPLELSKVKVVDIGFKVISLLAFLQIASTILHFTAASRLYSPKLNFRTTPD